MSDPTRRAAIVTGAAGGIGSAITARLDKDCIDVLAVDLVAPASGPGVGFAADLSTREGNKEAVEAALDQFGRLDMIVANAGVQHVSPVADFAEDRWDTLIALLLTSPFLLAKYGWNALVDAPEGGRFLVIASVHALVASPYKAGYVAAKHGALGLVKTLALEGAEHGISACAICPGWVRTPLVEKQVAAQAAAHGMPEDRVLQDVMLAAQPVKEAHRARRGGRGGRRSCSARTAGRSPASPSRWIKDGLPDESNYLPARHCERFGRRHVRPVRGDGSGYDGLLHRRARSSGQPGRHGAGRRSPG